MVFEFISAWMLSTNDFLLGHLSFITHVFAAVFLLLSEHMVSLRIIAPLMDWIERTVFSNIILLPNLIATLFFIVWATFSIVLYEYLFRIILLRYQAHMVFVLLIFLVITAYLVNMKYRD